jgi:hypothetical protein
MANPFEQIRANSNDQRRSMNWYQKQVAQLASNINSPSAAMRSDMFETQGTIEVGSMYLYRYDPKMKNKLPYYDTFPLVLPYETASGGFYGLNLHYLPYLLRAKVLGELIQTANDKTIGADTKMRYNWSLLKSVGNEVRPCVKRYLLSNVVTRFYKVNPEDWKAAIFLPIENFQGASKDQVFRDSRAMI